MKRSGEEAWVPALLAWYGHIARDLPWRQTRDPYAILVSELMLQQTQVATVISYFRRFMKRFPTVRALAEADPQRVLKAWEGLGYYSRARNLRAAAKEIVTVHKGKVPSDPRRLQSLPGIGAYTAAAVASIAFGVAAVAIDANVRRVSARLIGMTGNPDTARARNRMEAMLSRGISGVDAGTFNQALMELGALICRPADPCCEECPVHPWCRARKNGTVNRIPASASRRKPPHRKAVAAIVLRRGRVLLIRRPGRGMLADMWVFPGGEILDERAPATVLRASVHAQTGLTVETLSRIGDVRHGYSHFTVTADVFTCGSVTGRIVRGDAVRWVAISDFADHPLPGITRKIAVLASLLPASSPKGGPT